MRYMVLQGSIIKGWSAETDQIFDDNTTVTFGRLHSNGVWEDEDIGHVVCPDTLAAMGCGHIEVPHPDEGGYDIALNTVY